MPASPEHGEGARADTAELERVPLDHGRVLLTRNGHPVAALVPVSDLRRLEEIDASEDAYWADEAAKALRQWEDDGRPQGVSLEKVARELGIEMSSEP